MLLLPGRPQAGGGHDKGYVMTYMWTQKMAAGARQKKLGWKLIPSFSQSIIEQVFTCWALASALDITQ